jgi:hypothetical protein
MVHYSLDINTRLKVYFIAAGVSILLSFILSFFQNIIPVKLITPSAIMIYGVLLWAFDNYFWKFSMLSNFVKIPNLNGKWSGTVKRNENEVIDITMLISQTWTKIDFITESNSTISSARSVHLTVENNDYITVLFVYKVKSRTGLDDTSLDGDGVTELRFRPNDSSQKLEGPYYSSKLRKGYIAVSK